MLGRRILCWLHLHFFPSKYIFIYNYCRSCCNYSSLFKSSSTCAVDQIIRRNMLQLKDLKVQNQDQPIRAVGLNVFCGSIPSFWHQVCGCHHRASLGTWWRPSAAARCSLKFWKGSRCIEKVEEAQGNTVLTKKLDLWSLWFPFVVLMSLPFITISTFYLFHSSMFFPFPFLPDRSWSTWPRRTADGLVRHFGSLVTSMNTLFKSISGGVTWEDPAEVLFEVGAEWVAVFTFYIAFCCY